MIQYLIILISYAIAVCAASPSLVITMMCRDEEVNIKANLAKWLTIVDYFVFMIDSRTKDNTEESIRAVLTGKKEFKIAKYEFEGFGSARTLSLDVAWATFPQASHVLIADPDWAPRVETMNIQDLSIDSRVYRFSVFDRNGITRRKMDWLLKHRAGLGMKYHLHEVLDIGPYDTVHNINWVIDEIEKPGSWHTTVGHGHSMSLKRYEFDLEMLHKDLLQYGHNPHTDYYLGITNNAVTDKLIEMGKDPGNYLKDSIYYLMKRVTSVYVDEFTDERWACMYMLGITFTNHVKDYTKAVHWFSMCRDYNPAQLECGIALSKLHLLYGVFDSAVTELNLILRQDTVDRDYLTHFKQKGCEVPEILITIYGQKALNNLLNANEAKYLLLMLQMRLNPMCNGPMEFGPEAKAIVLSILKSEELQDPSAKRFNFESSIDSLCADPGLQNFLLGNKFVAHPCEEFKPQMALAMQCAMFTFNMPPANEEMQAGTDAKEFVGAALVMDIIHHIYNGNSAKVFKSGHTYRFLFAKYFNPKIVYNLIGFFDRTGFTQYEIVVVSDENIINEMKQTIDSCKIILKNGLPTIIYSKVELVDYLKHAITRKKYSTPSTRMSVLFDYVEYNYGLSMSEDYTNELTSMKELLTPDGVIGVTYFTKNHHVDKINKAIENKNATIFAPFSVESSRLVKSYLELNGMSVLVKDYALVTYLGGEPTTPIMKHDHIMVPARVNWKGYTQREATAILNSLGLKASAWMPSGYAHPFENFDFYQLQKFWALGISQEQFVEDYLTFFRYTVYVQNTDSATSRRASLSVETFQNENMSKRVLVIDRLGSLSGSFIGSVERAKQGLSTSLAFAPYSMTNRVALNYIVMPTVTKALSHLSSGFSLYQLHKLNKEFNVEYGLNVTDAESILRLVSVLNYLESVNAITFVCENCEVSIGNSDNAHKPFASTETKQSMVEVEMSHVGGSTTSEVNENTVKLRGLRATTFIFDESANESKKGVASSSGSASTLDTETKIARMKSLGFSDAKIAEVLSKSEGNRNSVTDNAESKPVESQKLEEKSSTESEVKSSIGLDIETQTKRMKALGFSDAKIAEILGRKDKSKINGLLIEKPGEAKPSTASIDVTASGGSAASGGLDTETQIKRMKALGFSDSKIAEILAKKGSSTNVGSAVKTEEISDVPKVEKSKSLETKPKTTTLDAETKAKRMKQLGFSDAKIAELLAQTDGTTKPATEKIEPTPETNTVSTTTPENKDDLKQKLKSILTVLADKEKKGGSSEEKTTTKNEGSASTTQSNSQVTGGLLEKIGQSKTTAKASKATTSTSTSKTSTKPTQTAGDIVDKAALVKLPTTQSKEELIASYRRIECFHWILDSKTLPSDCNLVGPVKRKTSILGTVSQAKLEFDVTQFKYLQHHNLLSSRLPLDTLLIKYEEMLSFVRNRKPSEQKKLSRLAMSSLPTTSTGMLNRVVQVSSADADVTDLVHFGAIRYIQSMAEDLNADFAVVDVLMKDKALIDLTTALLTSTIWFDSSNGFGLVSHHDDGLVLESVKALSQYIAFAVSTSSKSYRVLKYYTVAMNLDRPGNSAVAMATGEEMVGIFWLNPSTGVPDSKEPIEDGLRIYDDVAAGKLFAQGISVYPSAHSDFFSKSGDLLIDVAARCNSTNSELVQRKANRLVLLQPRRPFFFTVPENKEAVKSNSVDEFESRTMIALVVFLARA